MTEQNSGDRSKQIIVMEKKKSTGIAEKLHFLKLEP